jgi:uncharacterized protein
VAPRGDIPRRLRRCPRVPARPGLEVRAARGFRARLVGLAGLAVPRSGLGLLLPGTRSAHTFGMRFDLDLVWLDRAGSVVRVDHRVPPARLRSCRRAAALLELPGGHAAEAGLALGALVLAGPPRARARRGQ